MRYSHEHKLECIELYRQGIWPETPEGIKTSNFHLMVRYLGSYRIILRKAHYFICCFSSDSVLISSKSR